MVLRNRLIFCLANEAVSNRPSSSERCDQKGPSVDGSKMGCDSSQPVENGIGPSSKTQPGGNGPSLGSDSKGNSDKSSGGGGINHNAEGTSEEETEPKRDIWLYDRTKRRKLILYLSLLQATNHDSANSYYLLLSDVEDLMETLEWLDELEEMMQDEILLLYTIGSHHPAFTFEQRTFLSTVLNRFRESLSRYSKSFVQGYPSPPSPLSNQILNQHFLPPQVTLSTNNDSKLILSDSRQLN
jgi:hypothetical protein